MMSLEEMEANLTPSRKFEEKSCEPCRKSKAEPTKVGEHLYIVEVDGKAEYRILTQDGRLIPVEDDWSMSYGW